MREQIVQILKQHPYGLKAREIANYIIGADRRRVNQILYSNMAMFEVENYNWTLKKQESKKKVLTSYGASKRTTIDTNRKTEKTSLYSTYEYYPKAPTFSSYDYTSSSYTASSAITRRAQIVEQPRPELVVARKCIGNCSTCNRDRCIEEF